jgi:hypothetical protein
MITSLTTSLVRIATFWYIIGALVLFLGDPAWAESLYERMLSYPWVPDMEMHGLGTAAAVQWRLLAYWTVPMAAIWACAVGVGVLVAEIQCQLGLRQQRLNLKPTGNFWGVIVLNYSLGSLPRATTPVLSGQAVTLGGPGAAKPGAAVAYVELHGAIKDAVKMLSAAERQLAEELLQLLLQSPDHYAGLGHGVGLLEHTLNVVTEAAGKVTPEFRLPLLAALSHDIGKLITFQPDGAGGWKRKGLHSRESARILATLPAFQELPELHQRGLLLAVKYDHAPNKMPELRGDREACTLAMRTISALAQADRKATAGEKERHLERLQPEDLLWKDFVDFLREAPVVQRGVKGAANQVNNPPDSPYLFIYEAPWRDAAVRRLPAEVAAALDLTRRDAGKMAKYTRYLVERLRKEGLLVETYVNTGKDGATEAMEVSTTNPLWDIQSGTGEKAVVLRGIIVVKADELWKKLNYRVSVKSPFPVQILAPNANPSGRVNEAPRANREEPRTPDVSDGLKLPDVDSKDAMASLGLTAEPSDDSGKASKPKTRARGGFRAAPEAAPVSDSVFGLKAEGTGAPVPAPAPATAQPAVAELEPVATPEAADQEALEQAELAAAMASSTGVEATAENEGESLALSNALAYLTLPAPEPDAEAAAAGDSSSDVPVVESVPVEPTAAAPAANVVPDIAPPASPAAKRPTEKPAGPPKRAKEAPAAPAPAKVQAPAAEKPVVGEPVGELSRAERREGLAVADAAAVALYPGLKLGDKYYTEHSRAVQDGLKKPGSRYKGDREKQPLELTESGPRRGRRRLTS